MTETYIVIRENVMCEIVGPFATAEDAELWQQLDIAERGPVDYQVVQLTNPSDDSVRFSADVTNEE